jgi:single-stranded DNA-binding protein
MNVVTITGRLVDTPKALTFKDGGAAVGKIAVENPFAKDKKADFFQFIAFGKVGEILVKATKGSMIALNGRLSQNDYKKPDGTWVNSNRIVIDRFDFITSPERLTPENELAMQNKRQALFEPKQTSLDDVAIEQTRIDREKQEKELFDLTDSDSNPTVEDDLPF